MIATGSLEPADDGSNSDEPVIAWRVWRLWNNRLHAIGRPVAWEPGENRAVCLRSENHRPPAQWCHCGFWALRNPVAAMRLARQVDVRRAVAPGIPGSDRDWTIAVGLIVGYGAIAMHGPEGYRAELARLACIFSDAPESPGPEHAGLREAVAAEYGVPCISLEAAISIGFLGEMGVDGQAVEELKAWIAGGRGRRPALTETEITDMRIIFLIAAGKTNKEIARELGLKSRTVEARLRHVMQRVVPVPPPRSAA